MAGRFRVVDAEVEWVRGVESRFGCGDVDARESNRGFGG